MVTILGDLVDDEQVQALLATLGTPYHWGKGSPASPWPPGPSDCSGYAQAALVMLGLLSADQPDRTADMLHDLARRVYEDRLGDLACYGTASRITHVMVCLGRGWVIGPRGGGSQTLGNDPKALVELKRIDYRVDLVGIGRFGPDPIPVRH
jgi:cell wall-associated NlpC family hydrolase